jgi:hypothetical protein
MSGTSPFTPLVEYATKFFGVKKYRLVGFTKELEKQKRP